MMNKPLPTITPIDKPYWEYTSRHELRYQQCDACEALRFPASPVCPECGDGGHHWEPLSGRGRVLSWVVFHQSYFPSLADAIPYNVAMIALDEGVVTISNLVDVSNDEISIGMPVTVVFEDVTPAISIPKFRPVKD